jgi:hypothetical protein
LLHGPSSALGRLFLSVGLFGNKVYYRFVLRKISRRKEVVENDGASLEVLLESQGMGLVDDAAVARTLERVASA